MAHIKQLPSGNYRVQVRLTGLRPISRTFSAKKLATAFAREVEGDTELARKLGAPVQLCPTFRELVTLYQDQYGGKDPSTEGRLRFWVGRFGDRKVLEMDEYQVDDGLLALADKGLTGSTVNRYKSTLSAVFIFFIQHRDYKRLKNPVCKESVTRVSENPSKDRFLTQEEQARLLAACQCASWDRLYVLVLMALTTGCRKGELMGLSWADVDLKGRRAYLGKTKTGKPRYAPLTPPVIEELMRFRGTGLVFPAGKGSGAFDIKKQWINVLADAGIGHCRFHDLRHTAASNLVQAGRTLFEVATLLGHSTTTMTARYAHLATGDTQRMVDDVMGQLR